MICPLQNSKRITNSEFAIKPSDRMPTGRKSPGGATSLLEYAPPAPHRRRKQNTMSAILETQNTGCPCESHISLLGRPCCEEIISGARNAKSAKELLCARYTAFATCAIAFIITSTHPRVRDEFDETANRKWAETSSFTKLEILDNVSDSDFAEYITFEAHFTHKHQRDIHRERARFELLNGEWFFVSSEILKPQTIQYDAPKTGRNEPCPCGSGRKYKKCCARSLREIMHH